MGSPRQESWSMLPFPPPGDLPNREIETVSLASPSLQVDFFLPLSHLEALHLDRCQQIALPSKNGHSY